MGAFTSALRSTPHVRSFLQPTLTLKIVMIKALFEITTNEFVSTPDDQASQVDTDTSWYVITGETEDDCIREMHKHLHANQPDTWSDDWRDFKEDIHDGNQIMHAPVCIAEIPHTPADAERIITNMKAAIDKAAANAIHRECLTGDEVQDLIDHVSISDPYYTALMSTLSHFLP